MKKMFYGEADTRISGYWYNGHLVYYKGGPLLVQYKHFRIIGTPTIIRVLYEVVYII